MKLPNLKKYSDADLEALHVGLNEELTKRNIAKEYLDKKELNINGITNKDFEVTYADWYCQPGDADFKPTFGFAIKRGRRSYCIYYDYNSEKPQKWWPTRKSDNYDDVFENAAGEFIPRGFSESCENSYEFDGTTEEAIECLKKHGFTNIKDEQNRTGL